MRYINITSPDINNGVGCRTTLWIPGCTHACKGCHNLWVQNYDQGEIFDNKAEEKLYNLIDKPYIKGLTISGGDPLNQPNEILEDLKGFIKRFRDRYGETKDIWIYTGYEIEQLNSEQIDILKMCDVLVDGRYIEELRDTSLKFRGSSNQRIINLQLYFHNIR